MSCWVVPAVAAEYWGVSLDAVWNRIYSGQVPHKAERGFVFVDVDPWRPNRNPAQGHAPPATFVAADQSIEDEADLDLEEVQFLNGPWENDPPNDDQDASEAYTPVTDELPALDVEETATFGRLSWEETRLRVSRTRRPPQMA